MEYFSSHPPPTHALITDMSNYRWGPLSVRGILSRDHVGLHINELEVAVWHTCPSSDGQYHGDALSEQDGGAGLGVWIDWSEISFMSGIGDISPSSPYFRLQQRQSSLPLSFPTGESSPPGVLHRMVSRPSCSQPLL